MQRAAFGERPFGLVLFIVQRFYGKEAPRPLLEEPADLKIPWHTRRIKTAVTGAFIYALEATLKEVVIVNGKHKPLHMNRFERNTRRVLRLHLGYCHRQVYQETFVPNRRSGYEQLIHGIFQFCAGAQNV